MNEHDVAMSIFKAGLALTASANYLVLKRILKGDGELPYIKRIYDVSSEEVLWSLVSSMFGGLVYLLLFNGGGAAQLAVVMVGVWFVVTKTLLKASIDSSISLMIWSSLSSTVLWLALYPFAASR